LLAFYEEHPEARIGRKHSPETRRKIGQARFSRLTVSCEWCGLPVEVNLWRYNANGGKAFCSLGHSAAFKALRHRFGLDAPRPLIVARLRELNRGWPNTWERLEKVGAQIGAREPEIEAVLLEALG